MRRLIVILFFVLLAIVVVAAPASARNGHNPKPRLTPMPTATTPPASTPTVAPTATPNNEGPLREVQTISLVNQYRAALGLPALRTNSALTTAARRLSFDIGPQGLCQHTGTDGSTPGSRVADAGYTGSYVGEVVGCGYPSAQEVVDAWWSSPGHYAILTSTTANDIGCGWWVNPYGYGWATCDLGVSSP